MGTAHFHVASGSHQQLPALLTGIPLRSTLMHRAATDALLELLTENVFPDVLRRPLDV
jgi:hypothetical protein